MKSREPEVRNHLRGVDWRQALNGLYLDQHTLFDNEIDPVSCIDSSPLVTERKRPFSIDSPAALQHLPTKTLPVGRFQETGAEFAMNLDRGSDNGTCERTLFCVLGDCSCS